MGQRKISEPDATHPIVVEPTGERVVVRVNGEVVADSRAALSLKEADYPAVQYIPLDDVKQSALACTDTASYCPYKGDASYYSVTAGGSTVDDAGWAYQRPYPAVAQIAGHIAFYPDRVQITIGDD
jgi:uncharacterized protein (DUF427 family)